MGKGRADCTFARFEYLFLDVYLRPDGPLYKNAVPFAVK